MTVRDEVEHSVGASNGENTATYPQILAKSTTPPTMHKNKLGRKIATNMRVSRIVQRHLIRPRYWQLGGLRFYSRSGLKLRANSTTDMWQKSCAIYRWHIIDMRSYLLLRC